MSTGTLRLKKLQHTNGTDVATLDSSGAMDLSTIRSSTGTTAMTIDNSGRVVTAARPAFSAHLSADVAYGSADAYQKLTFNATKYNIGNHYDTSTGKFTAPVAGIYYMSTVVYIYSVPVAEFKYYINGTSTYRFATNSKGDGSVNPNGGAGSALLQLSANDYVEVYVAATATGTIYTGPGGGSAEVATFWTGCLMG